jgi:probable rRNA maturation factor
MLHLFGYDHEADEDRKMMRALEESILEELGVKRES